MKKIIFFVLTICVAAELFAQAEPHEYLNATARFKKFYNASKPDSIFTNFSEAMKKALPEDKFRSSTLQLRNQLGSLQKTELIKYNSPLAVYKATFQNGTFLLNVSLNNKNELMGLVLSPYQETDKSAQIKMDPSLTESPVLLKTLAGTISGTLTVPNNASGKIPVVLIIAGSGPVDRNGNSAKLGLQTNDYLLMAEALGKNGIASLRYDKRMVGESTTIGKEDNLRFDDYVDDAIGLINLLKEDKRFSKIIVMGHSEGSLIGILATNASEGNVNAFISLEGAGRPAEDVLKEQMKSQPEYLANGFQTILDSLRRGKLQKNVDPALYFIARPSIQMYLMSWCRFDPQKEIKQLKIPVLIVQGTSDLQVKMIDADKLKKGKSSATLTVIHGMNHVLKDAPDDKDKNLATYNQPNLPLKPELVTAVIDFIKGK
ncbi:MAG TPA: alpha/beta hydrolase [Mucilaginibacter sp.]|nr:alpha/beta hydrolase [Mucilaginibacter sp.]